MVIARKNIISQGLAVAFMMMGASQVSAHGFIGKLGIGNSAFDGIQSRAVYCANKVNTNCSGVEYEPQSIEGTKHFPNNSIKDGEIANGGMDRFNTLNEQSAARWVKQKVQPGTKQIKWHLTAPHKTTDFRYFMTKQGWNPNQPLSRDAFELTPFCQIDMNGVTPPKDVVHSCNLPVRTGYQVMLATWTIADTGGEFYQVADLEFDGNNPIPSEWIDAGNASMINASEDLPSGSVVKTRVFDQSGVTMSQHQIAIELNDNTAADHWAYLLADKINKQANLPIKAGQKAVGSDQFSAVHGNNPVYFKQDSNISSMVVDIIKPDIGITPEIHISGLASEYTINNGQVTLDFTVGTNTNMKVKATLQDATTSLPVASQEQVLNSINGNFSLHAEKVNAGSYQLTVFGESIESGDTTQQLFDIILKVEGEPQKYDYIYPQMTGHYESGTIVLQPRNNKLYQCKEWPANGYCSQYHPNANHFEPGIGEYWEKAWSEVK